MRNQAPAVAVALAALVTTAAAAPAQWPRWLGGGGGQVEFQPFKAPGGRFTMLYPKRDWQVVSGAGSVLIVFAQKGSEASVAVEHTVLNQALAPDEITDLFADLELERVKERTAGGQEFKAALRAETDGRRIIVIDFVRPGLKGIEQVRQYSLPSGADLFRLICSGPTATFAKYSDIFERMTDSFRPAAEGTALDAAGLRELP